MKEKKQRKSIKQKVIDKMIFKMQPYIENNVKAFEKSIVIDVCNRLRILLDDKIDISLLNAVISDLQNGGYKVGVNYDKEKLV